MGLTYRLVGVFRYGLECAGRWVAISNSTQGFTGQGQGRPVRIIHLIATGTIDERVMDVLSNKDAVQTNFTQSIKKCFTLGKLNCRVL